MSFVLAIGILNTMRWLMCAANCRFALLPHQWKLSEQLCGGTRKSVTRKLSMKLFTNFGFSARRTAGSLLVLALCSVVPSTTLASNGDSRRADTLPTAPVTAAREIPKSNDHFEITNYFMNYAGDHSLDAATVIEQPYAGYAKYIVQLHMASGAEQSVLLSAPPGGLQVEMRDMTGDKIPNDVILRPALIQWIPTVLVNDGHEHFNVAISGKDPSSFSSNADLGSQKPDTQTFALVLSLGFEAVHLPSDRRLFDPQLREYFFTSFYQTISDRLGHASSSGRAPPLIKAI